MMTLELEFSRRSPCEELVFYNMHKGPLRHKWEIVEPVRSVVNHQVAYHYRIILKNVNLRRVKKFIKQLDAHCNSLGMAWEASKAELTPIFR